MADVHAILARLAEGDPALVLPVLVGAVVLLAAAGVVDLFSRDASIEARLARGVSRRTSTATACRCGARQQPGAPSSSSRRRIPRGA